MNNNQLFRVEAVSARQVNWLGEVVLVRPVSFFFLSLMSGMFVLALIVFACWGTYTKKVVVAGQLAPATGVAKVHSPQSAVVVKRLVQEGEAVKKGQALYLLSTEKQTSSGKLQETISEQVKTRQALFDVERDKTQTYHQQEIVAAELKIREWQKEADNLRRQRSSQHQRTALAKDAASRYESLLAQNLISKDQAEQRQADYFDQSLRLQATDRDLERVLFEISGKKSELIGLKSRHQAQISQLDRGRMGTNQELIESEARRDIVVTAPDDGIVASINIDVGQYTDGSKPLATIIPQHSSLNAFIFAPSRSIGFIEVGDAVLVRYHSFPYQKFGQSRGTVSSISRTALSPSDLEALVGGIPNFDGTHPTELFFKINVVLQAQTIEAYGNKIMLQPGMTFEASIVRETRRIYEWMLDPIYSLKAKLER